MVDVWRSDTDVVIQWRKRTRIKTIFLHFLSRTYYSATFLFYYFLAHISKAQPFLRPKQAKSGFHTGAWKPLFGCR